MATREELLSDTFLKLADTLVDDFDIVELLSMLSERCVELLDAAATGIMLGDAQGMLHVMAASSERAHLLELFQAQNQEGPCLDAYRTGKAVVEENLGNAGPWPHFAPMAIAAGLPSVHAFPMRVRDNVVGTLNIFMAEPRPLSAVDAVVAQAFASAGTVAILQHQAAQDAHRLAGQLQSALNSRVTIEQAKGAMAERAGITTDEAFDRLRAYARTNNTKLTDVAAALVGRKLPAADLGRLIGVDKPA